MSKPRPNDLANDPKFRPYVEQWVRETCPLIYVFAPSSEGKTTLFGSLFPRDPKSRDGIGVWTFDHEDYCPALFIDADQGGATIEELTGDEDLCTHWRFDQRPEYQTSWLYGKLAEAKAADCKSILIEGLTSVHSRLVTNELRKVAKPDKTGAMQQDLRRCYIGASSHAKGLIDAIRQIKQYRIAEKTGVPIFVSLNTKSVSIDPTKPDSPKRLEPDWGYNLIEATKRSCDGHIQLMRHPDNRTQLITTKITGVHPHCKMRSPSVAKRAQSEYDLSLPGLLALWAFEQGTKRRRREAAKKTSTQNEETTKA